MKFKENTPTLVPLKDIEQKLEQTTLDVARGFMTIGKLLLEGRKHFAGDKEFGQWREEHTPIKSRSTAYSLMKIAEKFGGRGKLKELPQTTLRALVNAPEDVIKEVEAKTEAGNPPTRAEAKAMADGTPLVKAGVNENPPHKSPLPAPVEDTEEAAERAKERRRKIAEAAAIADTGTEDLAAQRITAVLRTPFEFRAKDKDQNPFVVFGVNDQCDGDPCSIEVIRIMYDFYQSKLPDNDPLIARLNIAFDRCLEYFGEDK